MTYTRGKVLYISHLYVFTLLIQLILILHPFPPPTPSFVPSTSLRPQLHPMPPRNFLFKHRVHEFMLLYDAQTREFRGLDGYGVHGAAAAGYVLDLGG